MKNSERIAPVAVSKNEVLVTVAAGAGAGFITTILLSPLDVTKTRQQISWADKSLGYSGGVRSALLTVWRTEGLRGFYRGLTPALVTAPTFWACYWPIYALGKHKLSTHPLFEGSPNWLQHMAAAVIAGGISDVMTNPLWVIRTRMQGNILRSGVSEEVSLWRTGRDMVRKEGFRSLYKGLSATLLGLSHSAVQFPVYEGIKKYTLEQRMKVDPNDKHHVIDLVAASSISKFTASLVTYPHEVVRSRMQFEIVEKKSKLPTLLETVKVLLKESGVRGLYAGIKMNMLRVVPSCVSTFLAYEYISSWMKKELEMEAQL